MGRPAKIKPMELGTNPLAGINAFKQSVNVITAEFKLDVAKVRQAHQGPQKAGERKAATAKAIAKLEKSVRDAVTLCFGSFA
jgi:hypothetical protein